MGVKQVTRTIIATLFRLFSVPVEPGLRTFGRPNEKSLVFVTANFDLTVKRLSRYLRGINCYLLVAPTGGINVWCAAVGGNFTAHSITSVIKTSRISELVTNRTIILPQLAAPGVDTSHVRKETGWRCKFGPVYAKDIKGYIANSYKKTDDMRHVKWPLIDRLDAGIGVSFPIFLLIMIILAIFLRSWLVEFSVMYWGLFLLMYVFYPLIPGRVGWHKLLFLEGLIAAGLLGHFLIVGGESWYVIDLFFMAMGIVLLIGIDFSGVTPLYKSDLDPLLDRIGIGQIGSINFGERARIKRGGIHLDTANCTACGICYDVCPTGVFVIDRNGCKRVMIKDSLRCERCGACTLQCPRGAISITT